MAARNSSPSESKAASVLIRRYGIQLAEIAILPSEN
jgi:hypothetical protein